jgi:hypothetical protein
VLVTKNITFHIYAKYQTNIKILHYTKNLRILYPYSDSLLGLWTNTCPRKSSSPHFTSHHHAVSQPGIVIPLHNQSASPHFTSHHHAVSQPVIVTPFHQSSSCRLTTTRRHAVLQPVIVMPCHNQCTDTSLESPKVSDSYLTMCNCVNECK